MSIAQDHHRQRRGLGPLAAVCLLATLAPAVGQNATWNGSVNASFNTAGNWTPGAVPTGTATLSGAAPLAITSTATVNIDALAVTSGGYTLTIGGGSTFAFLGTGIANTSGAAFDIVVDTSVLAFSATSTAGNARFDNRGALVFIDNSTLGTGTVTSTVPGSLLSFSDASSAGAGIITVTNGTLGQFLGTATAATATLTVQNGGDLRFGGGATAGAATITVENGGILVFQGGSTAGDATITAQNGGAIGFAGLATGGNARFILDAGSVLDLAGLSGGAAPTAGSIEGAGGLCLCNSILTVGSNNRSTVFSGVITSSGGPGGLTKVGSGSLALTGTNSYLGPTTVDGGVLRVDGSIATSSLLTVNAGGTVGGIGQLPATVVSGVLSPGNSVGTITVNGNLTFNPGSVYLVEVQAAAADRTNVTGSATLAGTLRLVPLGGAYAFNTPSTVLRAAGGRTGTFTTVDSLFGAAIRATVSYDTTNVFLTLSPGTIDPAGMTGNQTSVSRAVNTGLVVGGNPTPFFPLLNLPAVALPQALDTLSGEVHTARTALGFEVSDQFLRVMLDPFALGRTPGSNPALAYAPDGALAGLPAMIAGTQAADLATATPAEERRYAVWAAAFGSDSRVDGESAIGSHRLATRTANIAVGADMRLGSDTVVGIAAAGGSTDASLASGLGALSAEVGQAGAYAMTRVGGLNVGAAIAYALLDIDSSRSIAALGATSATSDYRVHALSGRIEASFEAARAAGFGIAPLAAFQAHAIRSPGITETVGAGGVGAAALAVQGETQHVSRSELGLRIDGATRLDAVELTAFARLAWAHYFDRDATIVAAFAGLPGSTFEVVGAQVDRDSLLVSAGIDVRVTPQLSLGARFDGEVSDSVARYAGTARIRLAF